jgi:hypothetical protein
MAISLSKFDNSFIREDPMNEQIRDKEAIEIFVAERPVTITLHLSCADIELALRSGGASLCRPAMHALVLARVFDVDDLELAA